MQSDGSSDSGNNLTDEQKLAEIKPLVSILKPPSTVLRPPPKRDDSVIEMELTAITALAIAYPAPLRKTDKELPDFPTHLRPSPSPPSSPTPSRSSEPSSSPKKQLVNPEDHYDCGTLAFMAGKLKPRVHVLNMEVVCVCVCVCERERER